MQTKSWAVFAIVGLSVCAKVAYAQSTPLPSDEASIRTLFDQGRRGDAVVDVDRMIESRLRRGAPFRPDPVLDRLVGEALVAAFPRIARPLLERVVADRTTEQPARYRLLLAYAHEMLGEAEPAKTIYRGLLASDELEPPQRRAALHGLARLLLIDRPEEALRLLDDYFAQAPRGPADWESELLASRAARMVNRQTEATTHLERASQQAWLAPYQDWALARVALDRALVAGLANDRSTMIALTAFTRGQVAGAGASLSRAVPECGERVRADDFIVIEMVAGVDLRTRSGLIFASRPGIAAPFFEALARAGPRFHEGPALSVLLRCSMTPRVENVSRQVENSLIEWSARNGAYPVLGSSEAQDFASSAARLVEREARLGRDSPYLIPVLAHLITQSGELWGTPAGRERLLDYSRRLNALAERHGAPADARLLSGVTTAYLEVPIDQVTSAEATERVGSLLGDAVRDPDFPTEGLFATIGNVTDIPSLPREFQVDMIRQVLSVTGQRGAVSDPRRRALALRLAQLLGKNGDEVQVAALRNEFGLPADLCVLAESSPHLLSSGIRVEDYPADALMTNLQGIVSIEFSLDTTGKAQDIRILASDPPLIFDPVTLARSSTLQYEPARHGGTAATCRGVVQDIRWRLAD